MGPVAFQEAIKEFGTNGGGLFNANSAHPFENPNAWTNLLENWLLLVIGFALPIAFGHMVKDKAQGRALMAVMAIILALGCVGTYAAEAAGNPLHIAAGVAEHGQLGRQGGPLRHRPPAPPSTSPPPAPPPAPWTASPTATPRSAAPSRCS